MVTETSLIPLCNEKSSFIIQKSLLPSLSSNKPLFFSILSFLKSIVGFERIYAARNISDDIRPVNSTVRIHAVLVVVLTVCRLVSVNRR